MMTAVGIDFANVLATCDGAPVKLTNKEFRLLVALAKKRGRVITATIARPGVGYTYYGDARTLDVHIRRLRQKLGACGDCIETLVGVGIDFLAVPQALRHGRAHDYLRSLIGLFSVGLLIC